VKQSLISFELQSPGRKYSFYDGEVLKEICLLFELRLFVAYPDIILCSNFFIMMEKF